MGEDETQAFIQQQRESNMIAQQDAEEFMIYLLGDGCEASIQENETRHRLAEYNALFKTVYEETQTCSACNAVLRETKAEEFGQRIQPDSTGDDTIEAAFERALAMNTLVSERIPVADPDPEQSTNLVCHECGAQWIDRIATRHISSSPEYMRIHLDLMSRETQRKNRKPIRIPDILDLTPHVQRVGQNIPAPLRYRLISVVYHSGPGLDRGHYTASVTGPGPADGGEAVHRFWVNDERVFSRPDRAGTIDNMLTINPAKRNGVRFDPYLLFYEYIPNRGEDTQDLSDSIAARMRNGQFARQAKVVKAKGARS
ncbi:hypothetical protein N0V94_007176 [Neodidymelliopsis sp. IMI 364377]|nr:hypothetical protein N0V94_007176 [Neodidymelliopsis sp. IMI 364377]